MSQLIPSAVLDQEMPANEIRQTRARLDAVMPGHRATWSKFRVYEDSADFLKRSAALQGEIHQAGGYVVHTDQFRGHIGANLVPNNPDTS